MRISDWSSDVCSSDLNARVVKVGARHVDPHIDAGAIFGPSVAHLGAGASCCHCAMIHASHACVIHALHAAMVHSGHSAVVHTAHGRLAGRSVAHSGHATAHCAHHRSEEHTSEL